MIRDTKLSKSFDPGKIRTQTVLGAVTAGVISFVFVVGAFLAVIKLFPYSSTLPDTFTDGNTIRQVNWGMLDGISSLATLSLLLGGLVFAFIDYVQNAVQRKREDSEASFGIYKEVYSLLMNPEAVAARRWVILNLPTLEEAGNDRKVWLDKVTVLLNQVPDDSPGKTPPGKAYLKEILNTFDFIGFVAKNYWNMENELVVWMSPPIAKVWERIEPYVEWEALQRNEPDYYEAARELGKYCLAWRRENYQQSIIIRNGT